MKIELLLLMSGMLLSAGCHAPHDEMSRNDLIGEWHNVYVNLEMPSYQGGASTFRLEANESNWEKVMEMKPIRTFFRENGTYVSEYRNLEDSVFMIHSGYWEIVSDSLILRQREPIPVDYRYAISMHGDTATFVSVMDFDGDGQQDDHYRGSQIKFE